MAFSLPASAGTSVPISLRFAPDIISAFPSEGVSAVFLSSVVNRHLGDSVVLSISAPVKLPIGGENHIARKIEGTMSPLQNPFTGPVHAPPDGLTSSTPGPAEEVIRTPAVKLPWLAQAIQAAAPHARIDVWAAALEPHLVASGIDTPKRVAALLGQAAVEAGPALDQLAENTCYTTAARLLEIFPPHFPSLQVAQQYVGDGQRIACRVYAGRLGNGDEVSGDGWRFRGSGLLQLTGRRQYEAFAVVLSAPVDQVADWIREPDGAAASACWFWRHNDLNALADDWDLAEITHRVTGSPGSDRNRHPRRVAAAEAARNAAQGL